MRRSCFILSSLEHSLPVTHGKPCLQLYRGIMDYVTVRTVIRCEGYLCVPVIGTVVTLVQKLAYLSRTALAKPDLKFNIVLTSESVTGLHLLQHFQHFGILSVVSSLAHYMLAYTCPVHLQLKFDGSLQTGRLKWSFPWIHLCTSCQKP